MKNCFMDEQIQSIVFLLKESRFSIKESLAKRQFFRQMFKKTKQDPLYLPNEVLNIIK